MDGQQSRRRRRTWTKQTSTATVHMKMTDPATIAYAGKGYSSRAYVRVRSFTFVSLSSCSKSRVFVLRDLFSSLYYTFCCIVTVVCAFDTLSPNIRFPTHLRFISLRHNLHCDSYHTIIVQADTESSVFVCISLSLSSPSNSLNHDSSDLILNLILNLNRYRQPIWMDEDVSKLFSGTSEGGEAATKQKRIKRLYKI